MSWTRAAAIGAVCVAATAAALAAHPAQEHKLADDELKVSTGAYTPPATGSIRVQTNLVLVPVVVRDAKGKPLGGLGKGDFHVFDNGKEQAISEFSVENAQPAQPPPPAPSGDGEIPVSRPAPAALKPRYIALFFDDLNMKVGDLVAARTAAESLVRDSTGPADQLAVFTSSRNVILEFTSDTKKVLEALGNLRAAQRSPEGGSTACPRISVYHAHMIINMRDGDAQELAIQQGIALNCLRGMRRDEQIYAVQRAAENVLAVSDQFVLNGMGVMSDALQYLAKMPGSRMLVLASSGFFARTPQSGSRQDKLIDAALHAGIVINSLDAKGLTADIPGGGLENGPPLPPIRATNLQAYADTLRSQQRDVLNEPMAVLAEGTGGKFFHNSNDLGRGFRELAAAPEVSYLLGFAPAELKPDGRLHSLKVKLEKPGEFAVEARRGYYAPAKGEAEKPNKPERFDSEVVATDTLSELAAEMTAQAAKFDSGAAGLKIVLHMDVSRLPFAQRENRHTERLRCVTALFDSQGKFLIGNEALLELALTDASFTWLSGPGLDARLSLEAPRGIYRLRVVVQELKEGKIAAFSRPVEIP